MAFGGFRRRRASLRKIIPDREWALLDDLTVELNRLRQEEKKASQLLLNAMTVKAGHGSDIKMNWNDADGDHAYLFTMNGNSKSAKAGRDMVAHQLDDIRADMFIASSRIRDWYERNYKRLKGGRITLMDRAKEWLQGARFVIREVNDVARFVQGDDFLEAALIRSSPIHKRVYAELEAWRAPLLGTSKERVRVVEAKAVVRLDKPKQEKEREEEPKEETPKKFAPPPSARKKKRDVPATVHSSRKDAIITAFNGWDVPLRPKGHTERYDATRYAFAMETYTKAGDVVPRAKDIASRLGVPFTEISISQSEKNTLYVDIPIPPAERKAVLLKDVDFSPHKNEAFIGIDMEYNPVWKSLEDLTHTLVAGTTGSGKSAFMRSFLCSLIRTSTPETLRLLLIDPKMGAEFSAFSASKFLWKPVVDNPDNVPDAMESVYTEMMERFETIKAANAVKISEYNASLAEGQKPMFELLVVLDEAASVFAKKAYDKETQEKLEFHASKIAQMARAVGIRLMFATQRPTKNAIPTNILGNLPTRVALHVDSPMNSRLILGEEHGEAANLLGNGDMLFDVSPDGLRHLQGAFITPKDVEKLVGKAN